MRHGRTACDEVMAERTPPPGDPDAALDAFSSPTTNAGARSCWPCSPTRTSPAPRQMNDAGRLAHREWVEQVFADRLPGRPSTRVPLDRRPRRRHRCLRLEAAAARPRTVGRRSPRPDAADDRACYWLASRSDAMKILFAIVDGGGNIPPQLAVARALAGPRRRGPGPRSSRHSRSGSKPPVLHSNHSPTEGISIPPFSGRCRHHGCHSWRRSPASRRIDASASAWSRLRGATDVDAVVVDMILAAGIPEIVDSGIPTIVFVHCFYRAVQDLAASPVGWMLRLRGTDPLAPEHQGLLQVVSARADLDPMRGIPRCAIPASCGRARRKAAVPAPVPRILVSLSTCAFAGQRRMLQNILDAIAPLPVEATVTVGPAIEAAGLRVPHERGDARLARP